MFGRKKKDPNAPKKVRFKTIRDAYELATKQYSFVLLRCLSVFAPLWLIGILIGAQFGRPGYAAFLTLIHTKLGANPTPVIDLAAPVPVYNTALK